MRKGILIFCVVALLCAAATAAMASEDYWVVKFRVGNTTNTAYNTAMTGADSLQISANSPATNDTGDTTVVASQANFVSYNGTTTCSVEYQNSAGHPTPYVFNVIMAVGSTYANTKAYISVWSPDKVSGTSGRSIPANYEVTVQKQAKHMVGGNWDGTYDLVGDVLATWTQSGIQVTTEPTGVGMAGFWYTYDSKVTAFNDSTDLFRITVGPPIPEPGSILALGSGLVGMVGFAIRRRRK